MRRRRRSRELSHLGVPTTRASRSGGDEIMQSEPLQAAVILLKELLSEDDAFLHGVVQPYVQEVLENEIGAAVDPVAPPPRRPLRSGRTVRISVGRVALQVPRHRRAWVLNRLLRRYRPAEKSVAEDLVDLYLLGVSASRLRALTEGLCGRRLSAAELGALQHRLSGTIAHFAFRRRQEACLVPLVAPPRRAINVTRRG
jgi:transposase-like protein